MPTISCSRRPLHHREAAVDAEDLARDAAAYGPRQKTMGEESQDGPRAGIGLSRNGARHRVLDCPSSEGADTRALDARHPRFDEVDIEARRKVELGDASRSSAVGGAHVAEVED